MKEKELAPVTEVFNLATGQEATFSLPPREAVIAAYAQFTKGDLTWWWQNPLKYDSLVTLGRKSISCGDWSALIIMTEENAPLALSSSPSTPRDPSQTVSREAPIAVARLRDRLDARHEEQYRLPAFSDKRLFAVGFRKFGKGDPYFSLDAARTRVQKEIMRGAKGAVKHSEALGRNSDYHMFKVRSPVEFSKKEHFYAIQYENGAVLAIFGTPKGAAGKSLPPASAIPGARRVN